MEPPYLRRLKKAYDQSFQTELFPEILNTPQQATYHVRPIARENLREELQKNKLLYDTFKRTIGDRLDY